MIDHLSIGVRDIAISKRFYDAVLEPLGYRCLREAGGYGSGPAVFCVSPAELPVPADDESGLHFCFSAPTRDSVDAFHRAALETGGCDNGRPGLRPEYHDNYYAAFVKDPDGYRIE